MQLFPTRATVHVALAAALLLLLAAALRRPELALIGGGMLVTVAAFRALAFRTVADIRAAGLEMAWLGSSRGVRLRRGAELRLQCELRNRSLAYARAVQLRLHAAAELGAELQLHGSEQPFHEGDAIELPPRSRLVLELRLRPQRVGRFAVHGLSLEVRGVPVGGDALFEAPLMFANPLGVEVGLASSRREGAPRALPDAGERRPSRRARVRRGEGDELRELREHVAGDSLKRVAWRASARRGKLLVREMEQEVPQRLTVFLDARAPGWAGTLGHAPLDAGLELALGVAQRALGQGDSVGLRVLREGGEVTLAAAAGKAHRSRIEETLASAGALGHDAAACALDAEDVERWVAEHLRPLDGGRGQGALSRAELVARVEALRSRALFRLAPPQGLDATDARLRQHLAEYGVSLPPRVERSPQAANLGSALSRTLQEERGALLLLTLPDEALVRALAGLRRLARRRVSVWLLCERPLPAPSLAEQSAFDATVRQVVGEASAQREARLSSQLRALGVRVRLFAAP